MAKKPNHQRLAGKSKASKAQRYLLERLYMLVHLVGLLVRVLYSQVTGAKPLQVQTFNPQSRVSAPPKR